MGKVRLLALVILVGAAALGFYLLRNPKSELPAVASQDAGPGGMTDEEREAYVKEFVAVSDVKVGPDTKPNSTEEVPGLLRVTGQVRNNGARSVDKIVFSFFPKDDAGAVLGAYVENLAKTAPLAPGASRPFFFQIPKKPNFNGTFDHQLR